MRTFIYVWVWFAFSILGFTFLPKAETFAVTQNLKSNFLITRSSEINLTESSAHMVDLSHNYVSIMDKYALLGPKVLCLSQIATYNPEKYKETSTYCILMKGMNAQSNKKKNGSEKELHFSGIYNLNDEFKVDKAEIYSHNIIRLTFSHFPDPATIILPDRYSISGLTPQRAELLDNGYQLDLHLSKSLNVGDIVNLYIRNIRSEEGIEIPELVFQIPYIDGITYVHVKDEYTIHLYSDMEIDREYLNANTFEILDSDFTFTITDVPTSEIIELKVSPALEAGQYYHLTIPTRRSLNNEIVSGSIRQFIYDNTPPVPVNLSKKDQNLILLDFDEHIDPVMAVVPENYAINGFPPTEVILSDKPYQVHLVINDRILDEGNIMLSVSNVEDLQGNTIKSPIQITSESKRVKEPVYNSIVINEVMAAPRAGLVLPNSEYVELLNLSNNEINISGYRLHNSRSGTAIPTGTTIQPGEYLILCPNARRGLFEPYGRVIGLTSWPTLLNNADIVKLYDREGTIMDSLSYTRSNYGSTSIAQGGYSLEVVNPYSQCNLISNLRPSTSTSRGTPGAINAVFDDTPDRTAPILIDVTALSEIQLVARFSKPISHDFTTANWSITPAVKIISSEFLNDTQTEISLILENTIVNQTLYTLKVTNIRGCSGNLIDPDRSTFTFGLPVPAEAGDIIINEILFNPQTGTPKFVEIYNTSNKYINLINWKLGNESAGLISNRRVISGHDLVMAPHTYRAITTDAALLTQMYPKAKNLVELGTLPSYPIREGTVFLLNPGEDLIERLDYHENFHHPLLRIPRGVSLERINPSLMPNSPQNWTSAAGAAGYATPGFENSQLFTSDYIGQGITVSPEVFAPESAGSQNYTTIQYHMEDPGFIGTIKIFDTNGRLIKDIVQNEIWGSSGFYLWNGTDLNGNKVKVGYYIIWVELLNLEGKVINLKKTVVVGTKIK